MTGSLSTTSQQLSAPLVARLSDALEQYLQRGADAPLDDVRVALAAMCTDAHRQGLGPEKMLVAVKEAWRQIPLARSRADEDVAHLFKLVLAACLEAYYGTQSKPRDAQR
jgi:hypothetical protein